MKIPFLPLSLCAVALAFPADKHIAARQVTADNIVNGIERNGNILSQLAAVQTNADKVTGTLFIAGRLKEVRDGLSPVGQSINALDRALPAGSFSAKDGEKVRVSLRKLVAANDKLFSTLIEKATLANVIPSIGSPTLTKAFTDYRDLYKVFLYRVADLLPPKEKGETIDDAVATERLINSAITNYNGLG
ncbi:hypothetical protein CLAFUW4_13198 [Fulvia fulva]|uniref:Uncharacterized protein n=1 Tax=Passalora fulva TaxID=5499 RepID=A0A9Q8PJP3_PASFU|nr:uncharacterized protein CLAFUR5_13055 [Fulvia fulva]KAK4611927.1 hypothetical protein CLAFUR4_13203 [Fulvia fulva]UJO23629.1 hypothetical protein CLAFUR5_13055 [Fulvia fulva]WPV21478.1 hypothetical protein CLAFUW4_13198 [Fulvia fulva]WPV36240.1 hypothetical protein CLAFUW7_13206 [Fulvia fulva]